MSENLNQEAPPSIWGIVIENCKDDISVQVTQRGLTNVKIFTVFSGLLFSMTMIFCLVICLSSPADSEGVQGVLQAPKTVFLSFAQAVGGGNLNPPEVLTETNVAVASGQTLMKFSVSNGNVEELRAPFAGIIERVRFPNSIDSSPEKSGVIEFLPVHPLVFFVKVPEETFGKLKIGRTCRLKFPAFPDDSFPGVVSQIGGKGEYDPNLGYSTFPVKITIENPEYKLRIGMSGSVFF